MHDYYYGSQADQFTFYRIPTSLFTDDQYKDVSTDAKVLYGILHKRMELSAKNGWFDEQGRVYIICTLEEVMEKLNCADNKATKLMNELENKCGLIERKRQGLGKPNLIYVKNFLPTESSSVSVDNPVESLPGSRFKTRENHDSGVVKTTIPDSLKSRGSNTDKSNTDFSHTENPIYPDRMTDGMIERRRYEEYFREAIEYDILMHDYPHDAETLEGILQLMVDTCCSKREYIRIASDDRPREVVKSQLMKLNSSHIQYVMGCLQENTTDVRNMKQYLLAALYNAPMTIDSYYRSKVNHDFYGT